MNSKSDPPKVLHLFGKVTIGAGCSNNHYIAYRLKRARSVLNNYGQPACEGPATSCTVTGRHADTIEWHRYSSNGVAFIYSGFSVNRHITP